MSPSAAYAHHSTSTSIKPIMGVGRIFAGAVLFVFAMYETPLTHAVTVHGIYTSTCFGRQSMWVEWSVIDTISAHRSTLRSPIRSRCMLPSGRFARYTLTSWQWILKLTIVTHCTSLNDRLQVDVKSETRAALSQGNRAMRRVLFPTSSDSLIVICFSLYEISRPL